MKITCFFRKFIEFMRYDKPQNLLLFIFVIVLDIIVEINMYRAILMEPEFTEKTFLALQDELCRFILFCNLFKRSFNRQGALKLLELIDDDFVVSRLEFDGSDELWIKLENYKKNKRKYMENMSKNLLAILSVSFLFVQNRNVANKLSGLTNDSDWPTPLLSHCPPEFNSPIFFIYTYCLQSLLILVFHVDVFLSLTVFCLSTEIILADFDTIIFLLNDLSMHGHPELNHKNDIQGKLQVNQQQSHSSHITNTMNLRMNMACIVRCHQRLNRDFQISSELSGFMISMSVSMIMVYCCAIAYLILMIDDLLKKLVFIVFFVFITLAVFFSYHNGQRIFNQNDILRRALAELPWTDKPQWFKQTLHIMMTRANVDIEMKPYGIYTLNYLSFKDFIKTIFSVGNVLYTKKLTDG